MHRRHRAAALLVAAGLLAACAGTAADDAPDVDPTEDTEPARDPVTIDLVDDDHVDEPVATLSLPDGSQVRLVGRSADLVDDVEVTVDLALPASAGPEERGPSAVPAEWDVSVTNRRDVPILVPDLGRGSFDPVVATRELDLPYERGEIQYVTAPTSAVVHVAAGETLELSMAVRSDGRTPIVCVEVVDVELLDEVHGSPSATGEEGRAHVRRSDDAVLLACAEAAPA